MEPKQIGFLQMNCPGGEVRCMICPPFECHAAKLYDINIEPYRQTCHNCGRVMMPGQTEAWTELFPNQQPTTKMVVLKEAAIDKFNVRIMTDANSKRELGPYVIILSYDQTRLQSWEEDENSAAYGIYNAIKYTLEEAMKCLASDKRIK